MGRQGHDGNGKAWWQWEHKGSNAMAMTPGNWGSLFCSDSCQLHSLLALYDLIQRSRGGVERPASPAVSSNDKVPCLGIECHKSRHFHLHTFRSKLSAPRKCLDGHGIEPLWWDTPRNTKGKWLLWTLSQQPKSIVSLSLSSLTSHGCCGDSPSSLPATAPSFLSFR